MGNLRDQNIQRQRAPRASSTSPAAAGDLADPLTPSMLKGPIDKGPGDVDAMLSSLTEQSHSLGGGLNRATDSGHTFAWGEAGGGNSTNPATEQVVLDPAQADNPTRMAQSLSHELGHVSHGDLPYVSSDGRDRDTFISDNTMVDLRGEAEATIMELRVRDDLMDSSGTDVGVSGATADRKINLWLRHQAGELTREELVEEIALLFARGEVPSTDTAGGYWDYYAGYHARKWDTAHPDDAGKPLPPAP